MAPSSRRPVLLDFRLRQIAPDDPRQLLDGVGRRLEIPPERVLVTVDRHANTSAASIPLALAEADGDGRLRANQLVVMNAMGGGFTWGAAVVRW